MFSVFSSLSPSCIAYFIWNRLCIYFQSCVESDLRENKDLSLIWIKQTKNYFENSPIKITGITGCSPLTSSLSSQTSQSSRNCSNASSQKLNINKNRCPISWQIKTCYLQWIEFIRLVLSIKLHVIQKKRDVPFVLKEINIFTIFSKNWNQNQKRS